MNGFKRTRVHPTKMADPKDDCISKLASLLRECANDCEKEAKRQKHKIKVVEQNINTLPFLENSLAAMYNQLFEIEDRRIRILVALQTT